MTHARRLAACSGLLFLLAAAGCAGIDDSSEGPEDSDEAVAEASSNLLVSDWSTLPPPSVNAWSEPADPAVATINGNQILVFRLGEDIYWKKRTARGWTDRVQIPGQFTHDQVSLAEFNGSLFMAYVGPETRSDVHLSRFNPTTETWSEDFLLSYEAFHGPPGIVAFEGKLFFVGARKDAAANTYPMWVGTMDSSEVFSPAESIGANHEAASQPKVAVYGNRLFVAHRNGQTGNIVFSIHQPGTGPAIWSDPLPVPAGNFGAGITGVDPAIASVNGYLHLVHTQPNTQNVWWTYFNACGWAAEVTIGTATTVDKPSLTAGGAGLVLLTTHYNPAGSNGMEAREYHAPPPPIVTPQCGGVVGP